MADAVIERPDAPRIRHAEERRESRRITIRAGGAAVNGDFVRRERRTFETAVEDDVEPLLRVERHSDGADVAALGFRIIHVADDLF